VANVYYKDLLENGPRNAHVKLTGVLDTEDLVWTPAISLNDFPPIPGQRDGPVTGFRIDHITYSIGEQLEILLAWEGDNPEQIVPLANRAGRIDAPHFSGFTPNKMNPGYDGTINLYTTGYMSGTQNFSIVLELVKLYS
jgi:hypothetical protein